MKSRFSSWARRRTLRAVKDLRKARFFYPLRGDLVALQFPVDQKSDGDRQAFERTRRTVERRRTDRSARIARAAVVLAFNQKIEIVRNSPALELKASGPALALGILGDAIIGVADKFVPAIFRLGGR